MTEHEGEELKDFIRIKDISITDLAEKLEISRGTLYLWFGKRELAPDALEQLWEVISFKPGMGSVQTNVQAQKNKSNQVSEQMSHYQSGNGNIIYVPLVAYGGFLHGYASKVFMDSLERFSMPGIIGEHYAFEVDGMSMYDLAAPGDFAIARPEEKLEWMMKGKAYVLQTIDGILIKIFDKLKDDRAHFHSYNKDYNGIDLPLKSIKKVYFVTRILKKL